MWTISMIGSDGPRFEVINSDRDPISLYGIYKMRNRGSYRTVNVINIDDTLVRWVYLNESGDYTAVVHEEYTDEYGYQVTEDERPSGVEERVLILDSNCSHYTNTENKTLLDSELTRDDVVWCFAQDDTSATLTGFRLLAGFAELEEDWVSEYIHNAIDFLRSLVKTGEVDDIEPTSTIRFIEKYAAIDHTVVYDNADLLHKISEMTDESMIRIKINSVFRALPDDERDEWNNTPVPISDIRDDDTQGKTDQSDERLSISNHEFYVVQKPVGIENEVTVCEEVYQTVTRIDLDDLSDARYASVVVDANGVAVSFKKLRRVNEWDPETMNLEVLIDDLQTGDPRQQYIALRGIYEASKETPGSFDQYINALLARLDDDALRLAVLDISEELATECPGVLSDQDTTLYEYISPRYTDAVRETAISVLHDMIKDSGIETVTDDLAANLQACLQDDINPHNVHYILSEAGEVNADAIVPIARTILTELDTDSPSHCASALLGFSYLLPEMPDILDDIADTAIELLTVSEKDWIRGNATATLNDIAGIRPEIVAAVLPEILAELDDFDSEGSITKSNISLMLHYVAEHDADRAEMGSGALLKALECESGKTRFRAVRALGTLKYAPALSQLEKLKNEDPDEQVQEIAEWAVHRIK